MKHTKAVMTYIAILIFFSACATRLEPGGAYNGDEFLAGVDRTIVAQKAALDAFVGWEFKNRQEIVSRWPSVTAAADKVRSEAPRLFKIIGIARQDYITMKSMLGGSKEAVQTAKADLSSKIAEAGKLASDAKSAIETTSIKSKP